MREEAGIVIVYTGNGKGKTTAAMGIAFRAMGYGMKSAMIQFIKGAMFCGELESARIAAPYIDLFPMGKGFVNIGNKKKSHEEHAKAAQDALKLTREKMLSGEYRIIICDEINNAVKLNLINVQDVLDMINAKPESIHLILTGRDGDNAVIDAADLVTEMKEIKHPFKKGITALKGIDF